MDLLSFSLAAFGERDFAIKVITLVVIYLFLPITAFTYFKFRHARYEAKVDRIKKVLHVDDLVADSYSEQLPGTNLRLSILYSSLVCLVGLVALMFNDHVEEAMGIGPRTGAEQGFPVDDSLLMLGMAILGAYLWGMQYVYRRYMSNDLNPGVFYGLSMRMLLAGALAVIIYNAFEALGGASVSGSGGTIGKTLWPAFAFVLGMFPQRGLTWLREKVPVFSPGKNDTVRDLPLEMVEGIEMHDRLRLEECGLDNCHDLATADFVPLAISTPYSARTLIDWILQAKLCVYAGDAMGDLRNYGIRTIVDLEGMEEKELATLALETSVTQHALEQAKRYLEKAPEIPRLKTIGHLMGVFARVVPDDMVAVEEKSEERQEEQQEESKENPWHAAPGQVVERRTGPSR